MKEKIYKFYKELKKDLTSFISASKKCRSDAKVLFRLYRKIHKEFPEVEMEMNNSLKRGRQLITDEVFLDIKPIKLRINLQSNCMERDCKQRGFKKTLKYIKEQLIIGNEK